VNRTEQALKQAMLRDVFDLMDIDEDDRLIVEDEVRQFLQYIPDKRDRDNFFDSFRRLGGPDEELTRATWLKFHRNHSFREVCRFYEQLVENFKEDVCQKVWERLDPDKEGRVTEGAIYEFLEAHFIGRPAKRAQASLLGDLLQDDEGIEYLFRDTFEEYLLACPSVKLRRTYGFVLGPWAKPPQPVDHSRKMRTPPQPDASQAFAVTAQSPGLGAVEAPVETVETEDAPGSQLNPLSASDPVPSVAVAAPVRTVSAAEGSKQEEANGADSSMPEASEAAPL